ncbi:MAG: transglycosylase SLT domain-containing protein [Phenylobacterium sp.]|uniref:lytic transglycosylase domain-containing protein n=1 Tax=Phenylobacterium sp. TaxID=1871053 RepID=UPI00391B09CA
MIPKARKALLSSVAVLLLASVADAQTVDSPSPRPAPAAQPRVETPPTATYQRLNDAESQLLRQALESARRGDIAGAQSAISGLNDPVAKKIAIWALTDTSGESLSFFEVERARGDLSGWPRGAKRQAVAERLVATSGMPPARMVEWFGGAEPATAEGAMALASAYQALGRADDAARLIRNVWRNRSFEVDAQRAMLARFGSLLTPEDHVRRADILLYGPQGPAARDMLALLPADQRAAAEARIALRSNAANANDLAAALPPSVADSPGVAFEKASYLRRRGLDTLALQMVDKLPTEIATEEAADRIWNERYQLTLKALRNGDAQGAYKASANTGLTEGADAAEAEFYAGWIALTRLNNPAAADRHFAAIERIGSPPTPRGGALLGRGRAAEARGDAAAAQAFYSAAARHNTTFYGQLAGEKVGDGRLVLGRDPVITPADRARFESRETVRAARMLYDMGEKNLFRVFVLALDDVLPSAEEEALLVDLARSYGDQDASMKVVRAAAQRGFILPERGYPLRDAPQLARAPEPALILGITRQESGFDPMVRSGAGARGMMQLMPATAQLVARGLGVDYAAHRLDDPDYNMRLGSTYLGQMVDRFSGSYVMGVAAYNAGPGRPPQWSSFCGDPRGSGTDPIDFIECIPFSETRNYVMRVMEGQQVYRARLNGGAAKITLSQDLARGSYGFTPDVQTASSSQ